MALWSKPQKPEKRTHTNAPRHWPAVDLEQPAAPALNRLTVAGQLASLNAPPACPVALMRDFVYEDGILGVPVAVEESGVRTCVFVYSSQDENAAAHYSGARALVYYIDDLVTRDGAPDRRLRLCVQRRADAAAGIFDQPYEQPVKGKPFAFRGGLEFRRWGGSLYPARAQA